MFYGGLIFIIIHQSFVTLLLSKLVPIVTNHSSNPTTIASGIMQVVTALLNNNGDITIILTGIFPGKGKPAKVIGLINYLLEKYSRN